MTTTLVCLMLSVGTSPADAPAPPLMVLHPHFAKSVEVTLRNQDLKITATHLTATFNRKGFEEMKVGKGWHLANGHLTFTKPLKIGGQAFEAGTYSLKARHKGEKKWELVLDSKSRFSSRFTEAAKGLEGSFGKSPLKREHLHIDIQPSGDKDNTKLYLEVHFDEYLLRTPIEIEK